MKPDNWEELSGEEKAEIARGLFESLRGFYIISQALDVAITEMEKAPERERDVSNIQDMEILREMIFNIPLGL